jgi:ATP synthase protein I
VHTPRKPLRRSTQWRFVCLEGCEPISTDNVVTDLNGKFRGARRAALGIVAGQVGLTLAVAAGSWLLGGPNSGLSALVGGGIGTLASLYMAMSFFRLGPGADPARILNRIYRGEAAKLAITGVLFTLALVYMDVEFGPMIGAYGATFLAYWIALVWGLEGLNKP